MEEQANNGDTYRKEDSENLGGDGSECSDAINSKIGFSTDTTSTFVSKAFQTAVSPFSWQRTHGQAEELFNNTGSYQKSQPSSVKETMNRLPEKAFSPKKSTSSSLKNNKSSSSTGVSSISELKSIEHARKQLRERSSYTTFKILSIIALLLFLPPILSLFVDLSCMGSSDYCVSHMEMHMDNIAARPEFGRLLVKIAKGIEIISDNAYGGPLKAENIGQFLGSSLNKTGTVYKLNHFGYCRLEKGNPTIEENPEDWFEECHTLFDATDVPSVLLKDIAFEVEYSEGLDFTTSERVSSDMVSLFRKQLFKSHTSESKLVRYASMGLSFSIAFVILKIVALVFDTAALFLVFGIAVHIKKRTGQISNSKVKGWLILSTGCIIFSTLVQLLTMIFERAYHEDLSQHLIESSLPIVHHFNYFTSGTVLHIIGLSFQGMIIISMWLLISEKPWIVNVVL
ncbi:hypothetical protein FOA43_003461 [Brettanomyces nanus]|uniref:Uncharacterized protein n=1 Tax=Eeniella nana TaxID=13502 RepID=A0A875S6Z9_EENNA|nr:uncharacterized protein FOA43_003461 [Brettanomyces nanus]QPG76075.1 hypothetical protein FOA43_003461 [Brettanomyces nanus]